MTANRIPLRVIRQQQADAIVRLVRDLEHRRDAIPSFKAEWNRLAEQESAQVERALEER